MSQQECMMVDWKLEGKGQLNGEKYCDGPMPEAEIVECET